MTKQKKSKKLLYIGRLVEKLVLETEINGENHIIVFPKGIIIELSSKEDYPHNKCEDSDIIECVNYLKQIQDEESK